jgi:hypothetical protein
MEYVMSQQNCSAKIWAEWDGAVYKLRVEVSDPIPASLFRRGGVHALKTAKGVESVEAHSEVEFTVNVNYDWGAGGYGPNEPNPAFQDVARVIKERFEGVGKEVDIEITEIDRGLEFLSDNRPIKVQKEKFKKYPYGAVSSSWRTRE